MSPDLSNSLRTFAFRLRPHDDIKKSIHDFAGRNRIKAGFILTAVGSVEQAHLRFANKPAGTKLNGYFEVLSLSGTFSDSSSHLHISVANEEGKSIGGHLLEENLVYTTLEVVAGDLNEVEFIREVDSTYGYKELEVRPRKD